VSARWRVLLGVRGAQLSGHPKIGASVALVGQDQPFDLDGSALHEPAPRLLQPGICGSVPAEGHPEPDADHEVSAVGLAVGEPFDVSAVVTEAQPKHVQLGFPGNASRRHLGGVLDLRLRDVLGEGDVLVTSGPQCGEQLLSRPVPRCRGH
jgi:hypothetical protein